MPASSDFRRRTFNEDWYGIVEAVNDHRLTRFGEDLSALRA